PTQGHLDRDLPPAHSADPHDVGDRNRLARRSLQPSIVALPPQHHVGVEQQLHSSGLLKARRIFAGSGASKFAAIQILPLPRPGGGRAAGGGGRGRGGGLPFLVMMISAPAAAWSTSADSCVLASYRLKVSSMNATIPSSHSIGQVGQLSRRPVI